MANTTNFNWETPDDTDLVKDGALAIRTLGSAIDTSLVDLKGGTTDQVLAKNSNTDMDFKWVADASGIPATIFDAKGDLIAASAADTAARLAVGANNTVLTADSSTATGLKWAAPSAGSLTLVSATSFSGVANHAVDNCFTSTYKNYKIFINVDSFTGTNPNFGLQMRASSSNTTSNYQTLRVYYFTNASGPAGDTNYAGTSQMGISLGNTGNDDRVNVDLTMYKPQEAKPTVASVRATGFNGSNFIDLSISALQTDSTAFDGLNLLASTGNMTGTIKIYGLSN